MDSDEFSEDAVAEEMNGFSESSSADSNNVKLHELESANTIHISEFIEIFGQFLVKVFGDSFAEEVMRYLSIMIEEAEESIDTDDWIEHLPFFITQLQTLSQSQRNQVTPAMHAPVNSNKLSDQYYLGEKGQDDQGLVQITADEDEIHRRIASFLSSKQNDVNEANVNEFCFGLPEVGSENSCARVDAVFVSRTENCTHSRTEINRVFNFYGPQTQSYTTSQWSRQRQEADADFTMATLEERLANAEKHLKLGTESRASVFERLQAMEARILFLESLSPEYFQDSSHIPAQKKRQLSRVSPSNVQTPPAPKTAYETIQELDQQIYALEQELKREAKEAQLKKEHEMEYT